eukprot:UN15296
MFVMDQSIFCYELVLKASRCEHRLIYVSIIETNSFIFYLDSEKNPIFKEFRSYD